MTVGFIPTVAKADAVGFTSPRFTVLYYNQGQLFHGKQITTDATETTYSFYSYHGRMDTTTPNMMFAFTTNPAGASSNPEHNNFFGQSYNLRFSFGCKTLNDSKVYFLNAQRVESVVEVIYQDGMRQSIPHNIVFTPNGSTAQNVSLSISGFLDKQIETIALRLFFNFQDAFGVPTDSTSLNSMDMAITNITYANTTIKPPIDSDVPSFSLPSIDTDGLPNIDEYLPSGDNVLISSLSKFMNFPPIFIGLSIVVVVGLVSYVLFGKK